MLPSNYRITVRNETGGASSATASTVKLKRSKLDTALAVVYDTETTVFSAASIGAGVHNTAGATPQNNTGNWTGFDWFITIANGATAGLYSVWLELSTDGGTTWPTAGESECLDTINVAASGTESRSGSY